MSSAEHGRFDAVAAAEQIQQQSFDLELPASRPAPSSGQPSLPAQQTEAPSASVVVADGGGAPSGLLPDELTDRANAKLFARLYSDRFRHVEGLGWYCWDQYRWKRTGGEKAALWAAGDMAEQMPDTDPRAHFSPRELAQHRRRTQSTAGMKALLHQAQAAPGLSLDPDVLDGDIYALCTPAGVVDLKTGDLRKPDPVTDMHSRATTVAPQKMPIPRWDSFLSDTFGDDEKGLETTRFLHILLGYSITGDVGAQILPFLYGSGANGKSVLLDVMTQILGEYANAAPPGFLMEKGKFAEHSTELTELHGRRIVVCSELKPNDKFNEARVKLLTGGDKITARRMRQDFFSFTPTHKLWLLGNHRPEVGTGGHAFWRRMRLIPFERVVPNHRKIDNLAVELVRDEGPGILHWLIEGARRYLDTRDPLHGPSSVRLATAAYETTEDHIGRFIGECCTKGQDGRPNPDLRVEQKLLYETYCRWCAEESIRAASSRAFAGRIRQELGLSSPSEMIKNNDRKLYPGLALLPDAMGGGR
ncbi:phage/plasmid primase, P4 family [Streptomyces coelicoflavus]|uniref:DNA primase family protein n=1 Tax=Streptomyces TaxID=1883 RepID=UPI0013F5E43C|nr:MULTISPECIES: phage/plasmid primase, P4 family [Streptomyces]MDI6521430.1 phage/plasmid primase, P4 family [Streptomyces coelicoflavus]NHI12020.1 putative DNA primase/helicase [Streptomyces sp. KO7888]